MHTLRILAFLSFAVALHAQSRGKIAIVRSPYHPTALDTVLNADAIEPVEIDSILPSNLEQYDAIFIQAIPYGLDSSNQLRLVRFIDSGGRLYVQEPENVTDSVDFSNPFWLRFGIKGNMFTDLEFYVSGVYGVSNEFTKNISDSLQPYTYESGYGGPYGAIVPILIVEGNGFSDSQPLAFISADTSLRVVADEAGGLDSYPDYYSEFIADVVCNYFNLCVADVKTAPPTIAPENISIVRDARDNGYSISCNFTTDGEVSVMNSLGIVLWHAKIQAGTTFVELTTDLRNGYYFVTTQYGNNVCIKPFAVIN